MDFPVRVRKKTYLWGSAGVANNLDILLTPILFLTFRSDRNGDKLTYVHEKLLADGTRAVIATGQLAPGESFTVRISDSSGIYVEIPPAGLSTVVNCSIHGGV